MKQKRHNQLVAATTSFTVLFFLIQSIVFAQSSPMGTAVAKKFFPYDPTPPPAPIVIDDGEDWNNRNELHATWTVSDPESGISECVYAIGTSQGATDVVDWTSVGEAYEVTHNNLDLAVGQTYYFSVKAKNGAGLWSQAGYSDGITIVNNSPYVEGILPADYSKYTEGDPVLFIGIGVDPDNDLLSYRCYIDGDLKMDWTPLSQQWGEYNWDAGMGDAHVRTVRFEIRDEYLDEGTPLESHVVVFRKPPMAE